MLEELFQTDVIASSPGCDTVRGTLVAVSGTMNSGDHGAVGRNLPTPPPGT